MTSAAAIRRLLRRREAAAFLGVSLSTFRTVQKALPVVRLPTGAPRYDVEDLERWIAASKENPCPAMPRTAAPSFVGKSTKPGSPARAKSTGHPPEQETSEERRKRRRGLFASTTQIQRPADSAEKPRKLLAVPSPSSRTDG